MKRIIKKIKLFSQKVINLQIRLIIMAVYFLILTPFALYFKIFGDLLDVRGKKPDYKKRKDILNVSEFLNKQ